MTPQAVASGHWAERRRRAGELAGRWPFAAEVLFFYRALVAVQERVYETARTELRDPSEAAAFTVRRALPMVREVIAHRGSDKLARAAAEILPSRAGLPPRGNAASARSFVEETWEERIRRWLEGGELSAVDRFLVRASAGPVLEALGPAAGRACRSGGRDDRHCPNCGGRPQVSVFTPSGEDLVAPRRHLECARCAARWPYLRMACASCGETETNRLVFYSEEGTTEVEAAGGVVRGLGREDAAVPAQTPRFPHLSIQACRTCSRYLINVDLSRDGRAVPVVDELAAIPLDLYAREQGVMKIEPNLMGL